MIRNKDGLFSFLSHLVLQRVTNRVSSESISILFFNWQFLCASTVYWEFIKVKIRLVMFRTFKVDSSSSLKDKKSPSKTYDICISCIRFTIMFAMQVKLRRCWLEHLQLVFPTLPSKFNHREVRRHLTSKVSPAHNRGRADRADKVHGRNSEPQMLKRIITVKPEILFLFIFKSLGG